METEYKLHIHQCNSGNLSWISFVFAVYIAALCYNVTGTITIFSLAYNNEVTVSLICCLSASYSS